MNPQSTAPALGQNLKIATRLGGFHNAKSIFLFAAPASH